MESIGGFVDISGEYYFENPETNDRRSVPIVCSTVTGRKIAKYTPIDLKTGERYFFAGASVLDRV